MLMGELSGKKMLLDRDKYNNTPLHLAALKGNEESVKVSRLENTNVCKLVILIDFIFYYAT